LTISEEREEFQLTFGARDDTTLQLKMFVGKYEAQTLAISLKDMKPARPLPLDLFQEAVVKFGYTVKEVVVDGLTGEVYTARIICTKGDKITEFAARPVDATTVAVKFDAPIFVKTGFLQR
jgi:uncharacterized protein